MTKLWILHCLTFLVVCWQIMQSNSWQGPLFVVLSNFLRYEPSLTPAFSTTFIFSLAILASFWIISLSSLLGVAGIIRTESKVLPSLPLNQSIFFRSFALALFSFSKSLSLWSGFSPDSDFFSISCHPFRMDLSISSRVFWKCGLKYFAYEHSES